MRTSTILGVLIVAASCGAAEGDDPFTNGNEKLRSSERPSFDLGAVEESCVSKQERVAMLSAPAVIIPREYSKRGLASDSLWTPGRIVDLASGSSSYVVLDGLNGRLTSFTPDLHEKLHWARKGRGPGELLSPVSVAVDRTLRHGLRSGGTVSVLDQQLMRVSAFSDDGKLKQTYALPSAEISDAVVSDDGDLYVAHVVWSPVATRSNRGATQAVLTRTRTGSSTTDTLDLVRMKSVGEDKRFLLPGPNPAGLVINGRRVAVFFPAAGVIDIFDDDQHKGRINVCMPRKLRKAYNEQMEFIRRTGRKSQQHVALISDVFLAPDGTIGVVGNVRDRNGALHIDRYDATGRDLGSIVVPAERVRLPREFRFGRDVTELLTFGLHGTIIRLDLGA